MVRKMRWLSLRVEVRGKVEVRMRRLIAVIAIATVMIGTGGAQSLSDQVSFKGAPVDGFRLYGVSILFRILYFGASA